jgi:hypothetical protein
MFCIFNRLRNVIKAIKQPVNIKTTAMINSNSNTGRIVLLSITLIASTFRIAIFRAPHVFYTFYTTSYHDDIARGKVTTLALLLCAIYVLRIKISFRFA